MVVLWSVSPIWAETIELVTYFPSSGAGGTDPQFNSVRVGNAYAGMPAPADGVGLFSSAIGIGIPVPVGGGTIDPAGALEVRGTAGQLDQVLFLPGVGGTLNVGIGTAVPESSLDVRGGVSQPMAYFEGSYLRPPGTSHPDGPDPSSYVFLHDIDSTQTWGLRVGNGGDFAIHQSGVGDRITILSNGNVGIGKRQPETLLHVGPAALLAQTDQGGSLELGGSAATANPVANGMPYIDFHFGRVVGGNTVAQDFNTRLINAADGRLDVQTSIGGAAAQTRLSVGANVGVGTTAPQTTSPQNNVAAGNLDANDVFIRSTGRWASQSNGSQRPDATGTYAGTGAANRLINTGFAPARVLIWTRHGGHLHTMEKYAGMPLVNEQGVNETAEFSFTWRDSGAGYNVGETHLRFVNGENGFRVGFAAGSVGVNNEDQSNTNGRNYRYMAWD